MEKAPKKTSKPKLVIRQTKTSIYRMAKANPLMVRENKIQVENKNVILPLAVTFPGRLTLDDIEFNKLIQSRAANSSSSQQTNSQSIVDSKDAKVKVKIHRSNSVSKILNVKANPAAPNKAMQRVHLVKSRSVDHCKPAMKPLMKPSTSTRSNDNDNFKKPISAAPKAGKLRRSISSEHFASTHHKPQDKCFGSSNEHLNKSLSFQTLNSEPSTASLETFSKFINYRSTPMPTKAAANCMTDTAVRRLQHPLKEWLRSRGKSMSNYQHLKCFGLQHLSEESKEEEKENIEGTYKSDSYEQLRIPDSPQTAKDEKANADNIVTGAIEDLHNLIVTGYPLQQCEAWLDFIKQKHKKIETQPQYWECRAAIEQGRGNISSAVECYKNSIINGANVNQIDESLGQLLAKFSLLNIETKNPADAEKRRKAKEEEVRNIFKSTIIQFAIKERTLNMKETKKEAEEPTKQFTGTPVRRSTRKSCAKFQHTPGKTMYDSWSDVETSMKENVEFKSNSYLA